MTGVTAVLPAFNEEEAIGATATQVAEALARLVDDYEVIVVNDGSKDGTREVVEKLHETNPNIRCISHPVNRGYGDALKTGLDAATKDLLFLTDGDGQFDPRELADFVPLMAAADLVIGYRAPRKDPFMRLLNGWGWRVVVTLLFGYTARDIDCAFKLFRRSVWQHVGVESGGATFSAELLIKARRCGYSLIERPVTHMPRRAGKATGANPRVILRAFRDIARLRLILKPCAERSEATVRSAG
jgi:glycosyltransferase involved in cell wall biosynthesis